MRVEPTRDVTFMKDLNKITVVIATLDRGFTSYNIVSTGCLEGRIQSYRYKSMVNDAASHVT